MPRHRIYRDIENPFHWRHFVDFVKRDAVWVVLLFVALPVGYFYYRYQKGIPLKAPASGTPVVTWASDGEDLVTDAERAFLATSILLGFTKETWPKSWPYNAIPGWLLDSSNRYFASHLHLSTGVSDTLVLDTKNRETVFRLHNDKFARGASFKIAYAGESDEFLLSTSSRVDGMISRYIQRVIPSPYWPTALSETHIRRIVPREVVPRDVASLPGELKLIGVFPSGRYALVSKGSRDFGLWRLLLWSPWIRSDGPGGVMRRGNYNTIPMLHRLDLETGEMVSVDLCGWGVAPFDDESLVVSTGVNLYHWRLGSKSATQLLQPAEMHWGLVWGWHLSGDKLYATRIGGLDGRELRCYLAELPSTQTAVPRWALASIPVGYRFSEFQGDGGRPASVLHGIFPLSYTVPAPTTPTLTIAPGSSPSASLHEHSFVDRARLGPGGFGGVLQPGPTVHKRALWSARTGSIVVDDLDHDAFAHVRFINPEWLYTTDRRLVRVVDWLLELGVPREAIAE